MGEKQLETAIRDAVKLHGHLGPFLVMGVRMAATAKTILASSDNKGNPSQVTVRVPLSTPYSCVLDGIQSATQCTIGNGKLKVENSPREITADFRTQGSDKTLTVSINPKIIDEIENESSRGTTSEELAAKMVSVQEHKLFELKEK